MDNIKKSCLNEQVRKFRARFAQSAEAAISDVIPAVLLKRWIAIEVGPYRERIYGPLRTLGLFLGQVLGADQSCQDAVARGVSEQVGLGKRPCSLNSGPYCDARKRLPLGLLTRMGREISARLVERQPKTWSWRGRQIKLVDGTTVSMPDTPENQACFPQNRRQKAGLGFPVARLVAIISLSCGAVLDWAVSACEGINTGETSLHWNMSAQFKRGDVMIADRCYAGYFTIALMISLGVDVVVRQNKQRSTDFRRGKRLGKRDHIVEWKRPTRPRWMDAATYQTMPATLTMRETCSSEWILATTLLDADAVTKHDLLEMYQSRWQVELDLRSIKDVMQMGILRCKSPEMVKKEIAAHLVAYNLVRTVMAQAACLGRLLPVKLSFKGTLQVLRAFEENLRHCPHGRLASRQAFMLAGIARMKLPERPGRVEPRVKKRRAKPQRLLTQRRQILRAKLEAQKEKHIKASLT